MYQFEQRLFKFDRHKAARRQYIRITYINDKKNLPFYFKQ